MDAIFEPDARSHRQQGAVGSEDLLQQRHHSSRGLRVVQGALRSRGIADSELREAHVDHLRSGTAAEARVGHRSAGRRQARQADAEVLRDLRRPGNRKVDGASHHRAALRRLCVIFQRQGTRSGIHVRDGGVQGRSARGDPDRWRSVQDLGQHPDQSDRRSRDHHREREGREAIPGRAQDHHVPGEQQARRDHRLAIRTHTTSYRCLSVRTETAQRRIFRGVGQHPVRTRWHRLALSSGVPEDGTERLWQLCRQGDGGEDERYLFVPLLEA